jgi:hypothetical protein
MTAMLFWLEEFSFVNCVTIIVSLSICPVSVPSGDVGNEKKKENIFFCYCFCFFFFVWIKFFFKFLIRRETIRLSCWKKRKEYWIICCDKYWLSPISLDPPLPLSIDLCQFFFVLLLLVKKKKKLFIFGTHTHNPCNILDWPHTSPPFFFFSNYGNLLRTVYI